MITEDEQWPTDATETSTFKVPSHLLHIVEANAAKKRREEKPMQPRRKGLEKNIPANLEGNLRSLRMGKIAHDDPVFKKYSWARRSSCLRHGSNSMHLHILSVLANRSTKQKRDIEKIVNGDDVTTARKKELEAEWWSSQKICKQSSKKIHKIRKMDVGPSWTQGGQALPVIQKGKKKLVLAREREARYNFKQFLNTWSTL